MPTITLAAPTLVNSPLTALSAPSSSLNSITPASIRSLFEKIVSDFPGSYSKKQKELTDAFNGILQKFNTLSNQHTVPSIIAVGGGNANPLVLDEVNLTSNLPTPPQTNEEPTSHTSASHPKPSSVSSSATPPPLFQSPWELWLPMKSALDVRIHLKVRESTLDAVHKLLSLGLLYQAPLPTLAPDPDPPTPPSPSPPPAPASPSDSSPSSTSLRNLREFSTSKSLDELLNGPPASPLVDTSSALALPQQADLEPSVSASSSSPTPPSPLIAPAPATSGVNHVTQLIVTTPVHTTSAPHDTSLLTPATPTLVYTPISPPTLPNSAGHPLYTQPQSPMLLEDIVTTVLDAYLPLQQAAANEDVLHLQVLKILLTLTTFSNLHHTGLLKALQTCFNMYLYARHKMTVATARAALNQMLAYLLARMETCGVAAATTDLAPPSPPVEITDVFISLKALCRLSFKTFANEREPWTDAALTVRCRLLALELLLANAPVLATSPAFAQFLSDVFATLGADLCIAITKNATAMHPGLFDLALQLFVLCMLQFRTHFKAQLCVLFMDVFFPILSGNAALPQKQMLLQTLILFSQHPNLVVEIYANYDCEMDMPSLLETWIQAYLQAYTYNPSLAIAALEALCASLAQFLTTFSTKDPSHEDDVGAEQPSAPEQPRAATSPDLPLHAPTPVHRDPLVSVHSGMFLSTPQASTICLLRTSESDTPRSAEESVLQRKLHARHGLELFAQDAQRGIEYLLAYDVITDRAQSLAQFVCAYPVDKHQLGALLGDPAHVPLLHAYVDALTFRGLSFVQALRRFLQAFRLPGEAQKIDRIMEKFADKFCEDNPDVLASADTAYTLAFSIVMLNTDLHSQHIKRRMTKDEFIRNCRGIQAADTLATDFFSQVYEDIKAQELDMAMPATPVAPVGLRDDERLELYKRESDAIQKKTQAKFEAAASTPATAAHVPAAVTPWKQTLVPEYVKFIFQHAASPMLQVFKPGVPTRALVGMAHAVRIATHFAMFPELHEYLECLAEWTPDAAALHALLHLASTHGVAWDADAWMCVLRCLAQLEASNVSLDNDVNKQIDVLFSCTQMWAPDPLVAFLKGLCQVSQLEPHRHYALKKLVEVACLNVHRIRFEFNRMFPLILAHFQAIVLDTHDRDLAAFAVDALRQFTSKFLDRDELAHFHSQHEFMQPFHAMMQVESVQELVLTSVHQLIQTRAKNMKSGWTVLFDVLLLGHTNHPALTESMVFLIHTHRAELVHVHAVEKYIETLAAMGQRSENVALIDLFLHIPTAYLFATLRGLQKIALASTKVLEMRRRALDFVFHLLDRHGCWPGNHDAWGSDMDKELDTLLLPLFAEPPDILWVHALQHFLKYFLRHHTRQLTTVSVETEGPEPTPSEKEPSDKNEKEGVPNPSLAQKGSDATTLPSEVSRIQTKLEEINPSSPTNNDVDDGGTNLHRETPPPPSTLPPTSVSTSLYFKGLCQVIGLSVAQPNESVAQCAVACFQELFTWLSALTLAEGKEKETLWSILIHTLVRMLQATLPEPLASVQEEYLDANPGVFPELSARCAVHASILDFVHSVFCPTLPYALYTLLVPHLKQSREIAARFNSNTALRLHIWRSGWTPTPPHLLHQESCAHTLLLLCFVYKLQCVWDASTFHLLQVYGQSLVEEFLQLPIVHVSQLNTKLQPMFSPLVVLFYHHITQLLPHLVPEKRAFVHLFFQLGFQILKTEDIKARLAVIEFMEAVCKPFFEDTTTPSPSSGSV